jgi:hypothetical protein
MDDNCAIRDKEDRSLLLDAARNSDYERGGSAGRNRHQESVWILRNGGVFGKGEIVAPTWYGLRSHPRFQDLLRRMGLAR